MKFTFSWLKDHIDTDLSYQEISQRFVDLGIEIESIINQREIYNNFVTGKIVDAQQHPNADKLRICKVDVSDKILNIVCGASNARTGIYVVVALEGAIVPSAGFAIKKTKIRGQESQGMMCSAQELCIDPYDYDVIEDESKKYDGIIELKKCKTGQSIVDLFSLDDILFDASITPNRADCFSVRGLARDLVGAGCGAIKYLDSNEYYQDHCNAIDNSTSIEITTEKCETFCTCHVKNNLKETPKTIAKRLKLIGQKSINPIVDVANYVCIDIGQPLHLFDANKISNNILIREANNKEKINALDGSIYTIPDGSVVAGTENDVYAISGIIGGVETAITEETQDILIESAYFDKDSIATTGQALHINTEARTRFERGIDPSALQDGIMRFLQLSRSTSYSQIKEYGVSHNNVRTIRLEYDLFANISGLGIDVFRDAATILTRLGCKIMCSDDISITLETPSWRHDLNIPEDIIEEIVRVHGINKIEPQRLSHYYDTQPILRFNNDEVISNYMSSSGYQEIQTFSFVDGDLAAKFAAKGCTTVKIQNPINKEMGVMRNSLIIPSLMAIKKNQIRGQDGLKLFESGHIFYLDKTGAIKEEKCIT